MINVINHSAGIHNPTSLCRLIMTGSYHLMVRCIISWLTSQQGNNVLILISEYSTTQQRKKVKSWNEFPEFACVGNRCLCSTS